MAFATVSKYRELININHGSYSIMAPSPQNQDQQLHPRELAPEQDGERIVVSGMSGLFPQADSVTNFSKILYNKVNPVTETTRWTWKHPEASQYVGMVPELDLFDTQYFMVHPRLAHSMDPMSRKILEHSYQAIYDAGVNPKNLNGKKVGVYIASAYADCEKFGFIDTTSKAGYGMTGCSKTMFANRVSYWLNAKGPSVTLDGACCGSIQALEEACADINRGICEAAIVGGAHLCLLPESMVHYNRCIKMSPDYKTRSFDENANGCTRSEAISILFLQKTKHALREHRYVPIMLRDAIEIKKHQNFKREDGWQVPPAWDPVIKIIKSQRNIARPLDTVTDYCVHRERAYAEVVHVKNEFTSNLCGEKGQVFGFVRSPDMTAAFLKKFYTDASVSPQSVKFIEAFGSATPEADRAELQAIDNVFCENRTDPLLVGSVISNIGFTDAASGAVAITKVLLGFHHGYIASNLYCSTPRQDIASIRSGHMRVVTENLPFSGTYAAVNCLSLTGVNSHVLLRRFSKPKDSSRYKSSIPRLVLLSARQEKHLRYIFEKLKSIPIDPEEIALLHNIHSTNITGHLGRGYIILGTDENQQTQSLSEASVTWSETQRPLWFVYSGMGSQWPGMGKELLRIPVFAAAIERCNRVLEPKGLDIYHIITSFDTNIFDNILCSFVGIAAVQIGLTNVLRELGIVPDNIIGHSVGELGCAYADGCLTAEEMILSAYCRGLVSLETTLIRGSMAAVGLGFQQMSLMCPPEIQVACHNSADSCTISGPAEAMKTFVADLTAKGIFAKEVQCSNIAYHSRYIAKAGPTLLKYLKNVIINPKARTKRWLSTSVPKDKWDEPTATYSSAEYHTNNLLSPVYFEETSRLIPSNAVLVEIAPHGLLQAILKKSLPETCTNIPLTRRGHKDNALMVLNAVGKLYVEGYCPQVQAIYPRVEFPVSAGTSHLANLVIWNHTDSWTVPKYVFTGLRNASSCKLLISTHDDEYNYLKGNVIQGNNLYPFASVLVAVWDTLAMTLGAPKKKVSVKFQDVHLFLQPILQIQKLLRLSISVHRGNGWFEVTNEGSKIASGHITCLSKEEVLPEKGKLTENFVISSDAIYEHFNSQGFSYRNEFQTIHSIDESLTVAQMVWKDKWETLIDGLLQLNVLKHLSNEVISEPAEITELIIDVDTHTKSIYKTALAETVVKAEVDDILDCTRCGGITIQNIKFRKFPRAKQAIYKMISLTQTDNDVNDTGKALEQVESEKHVALQIAHYGNLDTLYWAEGPSVLENGVDILVNYAGLNYSDVKRATGIIPFNEKEKYFGMDFSGLTKSGERVMGVLRNGSASTEVSAWPELLWPVPAHWTLEEAATVPLAYVKAFYYLGVKTKLQHGWRVLIHGATGALGQAAVSIALAHGCQVFATVSDVAKKQFLIKLFPKLNETAIGDSRDISFSDMVLSLTNGNGCDIVISCAPGNLKNFSSKCTAPCGVTIDTALIQNQDKFEFGMHNLRNVRSYIAADVYSIFESKNKNELRMLQTMVSEGIARGYVRPLSHITYAPSDAHRAFRLLAASQHRGRVLLRMRDYLPRVEPRIVGSARGSHLIVWDGSSFGLHLADKLLISGVTRLHIHCLNPKSQNLLKLRIWQNAGVDVKISSGELTNSSTVFTMLDKIFTQSGPVEGLYVTAVVSDREQINELPCIISNLDTISRTVCPHLKYFAVIAADSNNEQCMNTMLSRSKDGLPTTLLTLPKFENTDHETKMVEFSWNQSAAEATEQALKLKDPILIAQLQAVEQPTLSKTITQINDIDDEDATFQDLGLGSSLPLIKSYLREFHHLSLENEDILKLTKKQISEMETKKKEHEFVEKSGLSKFFSYVEHDELRATTEWIHMETLAVSDATIMNGGYSENKTHLFIIPGLEGSHARFGTMCERLKLSAVVLQPGLDDPTTTPQELATKYSKMLLENFKVKMPFYLLGYECGIFVALELASILENHGLTATVFCIGDGPEEIKATLNKELSSFGSDAELRASVAEHLQALMARGVAHTAQYAHALVEAACARIETARTYSVAPRALHSRIVLLRAQDTVRSGEDCSLHFYSQQPLTIASLPAPLARASNDLRVPSLINRYLDEEVLQTYENSNLCEVYVLK